MSKIRNWRIDNEYTMKKGLLGEEWRGLCGPDTCSIERRKGKLWRWWWWWWYIYYDAVFVCLSRKMITSHFRAERRSREVSHPLGLALTTMTMMMIFSKQKCVSHQNVNWKIRRWLDLRFCSPTKSNPTKFPPMKLRWWDELDKLDALDDS